MALRGSSDPGHGGGVLQHTGPGPATSQGSPAFPAAPYRTVHAVLPHTALRHRSPQGMRIPVAHRSSQTVDAELGRPPVVEAGGPLPARPAVLDAGQPGQPFVHVAVEGGELRRRIPALRISRGEDRREARPVGLAGLEQRMDAVVGEVGEAERSALDPLDEVVHRLGGSVRHVGLVPGGDLEPPALEGQGQPQSPVTV